jgi:hypothetical protein
MDIKEAARIVVKSLNATEKDAICKGYPFRTVQRNLMRKLRDKGVPFPVMAEISGYHRSTVYRICAGKSR